MTQLPNCGQRPATPGVVWRHNPYDPVHPYQVRKDTNHVGDNHPSPTPEQRPATWRHNDPDPVNRYEACEDTKPVKLHVGNVPLSATPVDLILALVEQNPDIKGSLTSRDVKRIANRGGFKVHCTTQVVADALIAMSDTTFAFNLGSLRLYDCTGIKRKLQITQAKPRKRNKE